MALALIIAVPAGAAWAANARNPYGNVDPRNDAGNDTGDAQVDRLNQQQLNRGPYVRPAYPPPGYYARPPAYYAPPPVYYAPRPYYAPPRYPYYGQ